MPSDSPPIYFDHNATTPIVAEARDAMLRAIDHGWGNPSSKHWAGRAARAMVEEARQHIAQLTGASPSDVTFTSGATEAINQVIGSSAHGRVVVSAVEHPAVIEAVRNLGGRTLHPVPVDGGGKLDPDALVAQVDSAEKPALVCVMAANNVTGVLQPVGALTAPLRERGIPLLVDAVQYAGKLPIDFAPDYLVITAHKLGGPKGVGAVVTRRGATLCPLVAGGGQEHGRRGGTEPVVAIAGFGAAVKRLLTHRDEDSRAIGALRADLEARLLAALPGAFVVGADSPRLPNTLNLVLPPGAEAEAVMNHLHREQIAVSAGSACHAGALEPSAVLMACGLSPAECFRALRISLGHGNTSAQVDRLVALLPSVVARVAA